MHLFHDPELTLVCGGVFAVLAAASGAGELLRWRAGSERIRRLFDEIDTRILSWWFISLVYVAALAIGPPGLIALFGAISFLALSEFMTLVSTSRADHRTLWVSFFVVLPLQSVLIALHRSDAFLLTVPLWCALGVPLAAALSGDTRAFTARVGQLTWGLMTCVYCIAHAPAILLIDLPGHPEENVKLLLFLIVVVESSDVLQYICGKAIGQRPVAPSLSPNKTVEGLVGGVVSSSLLGAALYWMTPFAPFAAGLISLAISLAGFAGGLIMSAVKRDHGVKDFGASLPGHGGILDRLDSLMFAAPVFFHLIFWCVKA